MKRSLIILLAVILAACSKQNDSLIKQLDTLSLENVSKIMIVAHPDDEMIWGGAHLIKDDYLVVCVTCGVKEHRVKEFEAVMSRTNDKFLMLNHIDVNPDTNNPDDWADVYDDIQNDLNTILDYKDWDIVVTHNEEGEYGHPHHIMTSAMVYDLFEQEQYTSELWNFGKYYPYEEFESVKDTLVRIDDETRLIKRDIIKLYVSQAFIIDAHGHLFPYENWTKIK